MGFEENEYRVGRIADQKECSEEDVTFLLRMMKKNIKNHQLYVDDIEKYRDGVVFEAKHMTDVVYSQWSTISNLYKCYYTVFYTFEKMKQKKEEIEKEKKEKEEKEGKNNGMNTMCQMFESQNLQ